MSNGIGIETIPVPPGMIAGEIMRDHLRRIIDHYGKEAQTVKTCEELSELIYELTRMINKDEIAKDDIDRMESEMADVYVMLEQLMLMFKLERKDVMKIAWDKITRQELRIEEEKLLSPYISKEDEKTKDAMPGDNAPPLHPNCKCSTAGYIESMALDDKVFDVEEVKKGYVGVPLRWLPVGALFQVTSPYGTTYEVTSQLRDKGQQICAVDMSDQYISRWFDKNTLVFPVDA